MTHGRCTVQNAARGVFGTSLTLSLTGDLISVTTGLNKPDDDIRDLKTLLRKQEFQRL